MDQKEQYWILKWTNKYGSEIRLEYLDEKFLYKIAETLILEGKNIHIDKQ